MDLDIFDRLESQVRSYIRDFPVVFARAQGSHIYDENGRRYLDFFSGAGTLNYGHNNPVFKRPLLDYLESDGIAHALDMATSAKKRFLEVFERAVLAPRGLAYTLQFTGPTGANAVEAAFKLARQVKRRHNIVAFTHSFHGVSAGALAATANQKFRGAAGTALGNVSFMPYDGYLGAGVDTLDYLQTCLGDPSSGLDRPAAVIVETVQGEGGINEAGARWLRRLESLCRAHDMLLIVDDIQTGCGRTGDFFSFEASGIRPDIVTLSKSLSGFGLPMSLVLLRPDIDQWQPGAHSGTFRGNNLAFVTAAAAAEHYWSDDRFSREIAARAATLRAGLERIAAAHADATLEVRGRGMILGLASSDFALAGRIAQRAFGHGVIIETSGARGEVLKFLPALTMSEEALAEGLAIVERALAEVLDPAVAN
ncbi:diaminobutyrate--2-oxoglutarate transaminase [Caballeronia sp. LZ035]|uniref:diaminobutyrate--2-oxoglutarate transaminase n=1 Tax=Caballeronia sp. LZ035 TaxID=3038568 RepID=UPI002863246A|nr:diaminobutyrate--2-oxoglutarate transaminase [Caballeronia sp. LZ035]MDR5760636.1 diaminobutyrate--2-oxoglutarate transaminase [Caballeronia sp. LZ035]